MDFSEQQKLNSPVILIAFILGAVVAFIGTGVTFYQTYKSGEDIYQIIWLPFFLLAVEGLAYYFIFQSELETSVDREGISYRYFPLVREKKVITYPQIAAWQVRTRKNFTEFVGTGIGYRRSLIRKRTSVMLGSKEYLELNLTDGKQFLFSTNNEYELSMALRKHMAEKEITNGQGR